jgi:hypothetical protein
MHSKYIHPASMIDFSLFCLYELCTQPTSFLLPETDVNMCVCVCIYAIGSVFLCMRASSQRRLTSPPSRS